MTYVGNAGRWAGAFALALGACTALAQPASAQTEIQWWHAMTGANNAVIEKLAADFNAAQKDYKAIFDRIEAVRKRLVELCAAGDQARDPFAVRLCVGAGWDGQRKDFTGLTDLPPVQ